MEMSILITIKKMLGLPPEAKQFDLDIITHINAVIIILSQLGVGDGTFSIESDMETWDEFIDDEVKFNLVKSYMGLKVRSLFDPPSSGTHNEALNRRIDEYEWRIIHAAEIGE